MTGTGEAAGTVEAKDDRRKSTAVVVVELAGKGGEEEGSTAHPRQYNFNRAAALSLYRISLSTMPEEQLVNPLATISAQTDA